MPAPELPPDYQRLLDPEQPLPPEVIPIATGLGGWLSPIFLLAFVAPFAVGTAVIIPEAWLDRLQGIPTDPAALWASPPVFLITAPLTIWAVRRLLRVRHRRRLHRAGRWREGLFILPEALLFNQSHQPRLISRSRVISIVTGAEQPAENSAASTAHLLYRDDTGEAHFQHLPDPEVAMNLKEWRETGRYPS